MRTDEPRTIQLRDYAAPDYRIETVALHFELDPQGTRVTAELAVVSDHDRTRGARPFRLDGDRLPLDAIAIDGQALGDNAYDHDDEGLVIHEPPERFTLTTTTTIAPADNTALEGLYMSGGKYTTQCEAEGFRRITFFPDRPDVLATYRVTIDAPKEGCPVLLSNGNLVEQKALADGRHRAVWDDPFPKPSYLFALVAGDLGVLEDSFTTASGRKVALAIWSEHGNQGKCAYAMDALKRSMAWDEQRYGLEYDLDIFNIVAVGDFNMGAMENKSLNIFNSKLVLASPQTATDGDYEAIESVIAHEYFHNWTGNRVTCRDWFQLSLKEGLTVYRDQEFSADQRSAPVERIASVRALRAAQFPEDAGPLAHPIRPDHYIEINNFYTATVYEKGAEVIRMYERLLGRDGFRRGLDLYFERHDGQAVTCDDFLAAMADANGADLTRFKRWYSQAGTPVVTAAGAWDEAAQAFELTLTQETPPTPGQHVKKPLDMPFEVGLLGPDGADMAVALGGRTATSHTLRFNLPRQVFRFEGVAARPVLSLNRGFSAPVRVSASWSDEERAFLMAHDSDPFARWEAGQQYATTLMLGMLGDVRAGRDPRLDARFVVALKAILEDEAIDKAFAALAITLPGEAYLADQMETVDVEGIHAARETLERAVAAGLGELLEAVYRANATTAPFSPDAEQAGRRALRNAALVYLAAPRDGRAVALLDAQYRGADNMTDRMAALSLLVEIEGPERSAALEDFLERFRDDALVVDKWFAVQARASAPDAVEQVEALLGHPLFTLKNPNRARSLLGVFAAGNPTGFHRKDGRGYRLVADAILELDGFNPQVAARLIDPLGRWRRYDGARQEMMKEELARIRAKPGLSRDLVEKVGKSLEG
ncbi:MAG: aminopeptidase N [Proteobacteria bacterium]|nr:aminopeptidase N [Pseudomonadota bacterium]